jgi:hypothetical protein
MSAQTEILKRMRNAMSTLAREMSTSGTLKGEGEFTVRIVWDSDDIHVFDFVDTGDTAEIISAPVKKKK